MHTAFEERLLTCGGKHPVHSLAGIRQPQREPSSSSPPERRETRFALPNTRIMLHLPALLPGACEMVPGNRPGELHYTRARIADLLARHTGHQTDRVITDFTLNRWFTPEETAEYGLIDAVLPAPAPVGALFGD
ncbi:ATP-dependent Clp protease proteolytic subunit [Streptomyces sp. A012304]|uniref:ATP-dependent Clp protease proteolytic subunit n=1 Tax=Streptomyces sp. A012304 TaxID=375446 RepID=UPI0035D4F9CD